jgi:hypothetical protein
VLGPLRWLLFLALRCAAVTFATEKLSPAVVRATNSKLIAVAAPYLQKLRVVKARPFHGCFDLQLELNPAAVRPDISPSFSIYASLLG